MNTVFVVQHLHLLPDGEECIKLIGVYRSRDAADAAVARLSIQPGFSIHPTIIAPELTDDVEGFYIEEYELDKDHWAEGFVTMIGDQEI